MKISWIRWTTPSEKPLKQMNSSQLKSTLFPRAK